MAEPEIPQKSPYIMPLKPGKYWWCACGRSKKQPFCDGSHKGTDFSPVEFTVEEADIFAICGCKHSKSAPLCDGTHSDL